MGKAEEAHFSQPVFEARAPGLQERAPSCLRLQPWPRWSGSWRPGTGKVRQGSVGRGRQWDSLLQEERAARAVEFAGALTLQGKTPGWRDLSGTGMRRLSSPEAVQ